jgi:hypothetical protein
MLSRLSRLLPSDGSQLMLKSRSRDYDSGDNASLIVSIKLFQSLHQRLIEWHEMLVMPARASFASSLSIVEARAAT